MLYSIGLYALNFRNFNLRLNYFQSTLANIFVLMRYTLRHTRTYNTQLAIILIHLHIKATSKQHINNYEWILACSVSIYLIRRNCCFFIFFSFFLFLICKKKNNSFRMTVIRITDRLPEPINFVCIISLLDKNSAVFIVLRTVQMKSVQTNLKDERIQ